MANGSRDRDIQRREEALSAKGGPTSRAARDVDRERAGRNRADNRDASRSRQGIGPIIRGNFQSGRFGTDPASRYSMPSRNNAGVLQSIPVIGPFATLGQLASDAIYRSTGSYPDAPNAPDGPESVNTGRGLRSSAPARQTAPSAITPQAPATTTVTPTYATPEVGTGPRSASGAAQIRSARSRLRVPLLGAASGVGTGPGLQIR